MSIRFLNDLIDVVRTKGVVVLRSHGDGHVTASSHGNTVTIAPMIDDITTLLEPEYSPPSYPEEMWLLDEPIELLDDRD